MLSVVLLLFIGLILWFIYDKKRYADYPPGPTRIPLFGCLFAISKLSSYPHIAFQKLAKIYGDVIYVRMGFTDAVIFNSFETVRDMLNHEFSTDRTQTMVPFILERMWYKNLGLIFSTGKEWRNLRRFTIRALREYGFGKAASMDVVINEELEKFTDFLRVSNAQNPDGIDEAHKIFDITVVNVLWRLVTGIKYELDNSNMLRLLKISHEILQSTNFAMDYSIAFPQLYHIFPKWFGKTDQKEKMHRLSEFARDTIEHHRKLGDYQISPTCYVDEFLSQIDQHKDDLNTEFTEDQLVLCLLDLFQGETIRSFGFIKVLKRMYESVAIYHLRSLEAGSDTTSNTMSFAMLYMTIYPEIQEKVQYEIDANVDRNERIMLSTKESLPYTHAALLECIRHSSVVPTPGARQATKDFYFNGHFIKKGMIMLANIHAAHFSETIWGDPYNFRPERFLTSNGEVDVKQSGYLLPFGSGSRKCLAASLAENSLFLYFSTILRDFKVMKGYDSGELTMEQCLGITLSPKPYKARYVPRT